MLLFLILIFFNFFEIFLTTPIPYNYCLDTPQLHIQKIDIKPLQPKPKDNVIIITTGLYNSSEIIEKGSYISVSIQLKKTVLQKYKYDICAAAVPSCPIKPNQQVVVTLSQNIPWFVLPLEYMIYVRAIDQNGDEKACVNFLLDVI